MDIRDEFDVELGDRRRTARLKKLADALSAQPEASFPLLARDSSELEAAYRLLRNEALTFKNVSRGHSDATAARCRKLGEVLVIHDRTEFTWPIRADYRRESLSELSANRQGFGALYSIAASADGLRAPLGTIAMKGYVHESKADEKTRGFWTEHFGESDSEGKHWVEAMADSEQHLLGCSVIHVCDREADRNDVLEWMMENEKRRFVVRWYQHSRHTMEGKSLPEALADTPFVTRRELTLSPRSLQGRPPRSRTFPERTRRTATVSFRAVSVLLQLRGKSPMPVQVVEALEEKPPRNEEPIHWILLTNEPASTVANIVRVIDIYRSRWLIEEYFKAIKTGCAYSKRQLDSASTLLIALALTNAVAWRLLALRHLDRQPDQLPATTLLNEVQLALLRNETPKLAWPPNPSIHDVMDALAMLGGHHRTNGPPGWMILGRALETLLIMEIGARVAAKMGLVIND